MNEKVGARAEFAWFVQEVPVGLQRHYAYFVHPEKLSAGMRAKFLS